MAEGGSDKDSAMNPVRKSERKVMPTEKGRQYQVLLKEERYDEVYKCLCELMPVIRKVTDSNGPPQLVHDDYKKWKDHYVEFLQIESDLQLILTEEEKAEYMEVFTDHGKTLREFKEEIENYFATKSTEFRHGNVVHDDDDNVSQCSRASSRSKGGSLSVREARLHCETLSSSCTTFPCLSSVLLVAK